jgi:hypothetical protein
MGCRKLWGKGRSPWRSAAFTLAANGIPRHARRDRSHRLLHQEKSVSANIGPLADCARCDIVRSRTQPGGSIRQQTKPFIIERKASRKPRPDTAKPIWGRLDADIAHGLINERDMDHAAATGSDDRA